MEGHAKARQEWESKCPCALPSPACQPHECAGSPLQTLRWEPRCTRSRAWCSAWPRCLAREIPPWRRFWGTQTHDIDTVLMPKPLGASTFQTSISTDHIWARWQPQLQAFFFVRIALLTAWRIWPSFAISLIHPPVQLICGGNEQGEGEGEKKLSWITGCSFPVLPWFCHQLRHNYCQAESSWLSQLF